MRVLGWERSGVEIDHVLRNQVENRSSTHAVEQGPARRPEASPRPKEVWAIRVRLQMKPGKRDLALFNLAIDSKLRGCDLVGLRVDA